MDRRLFAFAFFLLVVETTWLFFDLGMISLPYVSKHTTTTEQVAGSFVQTKQNVRRRNLNSVLWEESASEDAVFFHDSVLTLDQSSASLVLQGDTHLTLSENTLIVIEPPQDEGNSMLRVKFRRGDLASRIGARESKIETEEWTIKPESGSELNLHTTSDDRIEVEITKGRAAVAPAAKPEEVKTIEVGKMVTLAKDGSTQENSLKEDLEWKGNLFRRVYAHSLPAHVPLSWQGAAQKLEWHTPTGETKYLDLTTEKLEDVKFELGTHHLRLKDDSGLSRSLQIEVWRAPVIHLMTPLPRDRLPLGVASQFCWQKSSFADQYKVEISSNQEFSERVFDEKVSQNCVNFKVEKEGAYWWRVIGLDESANPIPALYHQGFFEVENPLEAPQLKAPRLRAPASPPKSGQVPLWKFLFDKLIPEAQAAELQYEGLFEWESVEGADHYVIEISQTPDFRSPLVEEKTPKPEFTWKSAHPGKFWWRVAAGSKGRLGIFTEPTEIELTLESLKPVETASRPLPPAPKPAPPPEPLSKPKSKAEPQLITAAEPKVIQAPPLEENTKSKFSAWIASGYESLTLQGDQSSRANLRTLGGVEYGLNFQTTLDGGQKVIALDTRYIPRVWKKADAADTLQQRDLADWRLRTNILYGPSSSPWAVGAAIRKSSIVLRKSDEAIDLESRWLGGFAARLYWPREEFLRISHTAALAFGSGVTEISISTRATKALPLATTKVVHEPEGRDPASDQPFGSDEVGLFWFFGGFADLEAQMTNYSGSSKTGSGYRFGLTLGLEW